MTFSKILKKKIPVSTHICRGLCIHSLHLPVSHCVSVADKPASAAKAIGDDDNKDTYRVSSDEDETASEDEITDKNKIKKKKPKDDKKKKKKPKDAANKSPAPKQDRPAPNEIDVVGIQEELESILGKLGAVTDTALQLEQISAQITEHDELIASIDEDMEAKKTERIQIAHRITEVQAQHPLVHSHMCVCACS